MHVYCTPLNLVNICHKDVQSPIWGILNGDMCWTGEILIKLRTSLGIEGTDATKCNLCVDIKCIMILFSYFVKGIREADSETC